MDCYIQECTALAAYTKGTVEKGQDSLVKIVAENEGEKIYGIMSYLAGPQKNRNILETREYHYEELLKLKLHGDYFKRQNEISNVDFVYCHTFLQDKRVHRCE